MNLPMPPTDSLYKFLALSGLIGILYIFTMLIRSTHKLSEEAEDLTADSEKFGVEIDFLENTVKETDQDDSKERDDAIKTRLLQIKLKRIDLVCRQNKARSTLKLLQQLTTISFIGLAIFTIMTVTGFTCWYKLIQQPSDKILFNQIQHKPATP